MKKLIIALALLLPIVAQAATIQEIEAGWATRVIKDVPTGSLYRYGSELNGKELSSAEAKAYVDRLPKSVELEADWWSEIK